MRTLFAVLLVACASSAFGEQRQWNQFRGPSGDGKLASADLPVEFDEAKNVRWKTAIPGVGWSSPVVWENQIWVTSGRSDGRELFAICVDAKSGKVLHNVKVFDVADPSMEWSNQNPHACPTPFLEAGRAYVHYGSYGTACLDTSSGKVLWKRQDLKCNHRVGPASSPIVRSTTHLYCLANGYQRTKAQVAADVYPEEKLAKAGKNDKQDGKDKKGDREGKKIDWDKAYAQLLKKDPSLRKKVESGGATKQQVIAWMKKQFAGKGKKGNARKRKEDGVTDFYAIVIGRLKSKDVELGEFTLAVDYVTSMYGNRWVKDAIVGKTVKVTGVSGAFLDKLLLIKRGQTLKVRTGSYIADAKTLRFGVKFHVLEQAKPFQPEDFGVPPKSFRGFRGELQGKIVEVAGYEVLMSVDRVVKVTDGSKADDAKSIEGKRVRIVGFYREHEKAFAELQKGDAIRVSASHANPSHDELQVTELLEKMEK